MAWFKASGFSSTINIGSFLRLVSHVLLFPRVRVTLLQFPGCHMPPCPLCWPLCGTPGMTLVPVGSALALHSPLPSRVSSTDCSCSGSMLNKLGLFSNTIFFVHCTTLFHSNLSHIAPILPSDLPFKKVVSKILWALRTTSLSRAAIGLAQSWVWAAIAPSWQLQGWQWGQEGALTCKKNFLNDRAVSQHQKAGQTHFINFLK